MSQTKRKGSARPRASIGRFLLRLPAWLAPVVLMAAVMPMVLAQEGAGAGAAAGPTTSVAANGEIIEEVAAPTPAVKQSYLDLFKAGGPFMYPLLICSILAVAIVAERFVMLRRGRVAPPDFLPGLRAVFREPRRDQQAALDYCARFDAAIARMVAAGVKRFPRGEAAVEKAVEDAGANESLKLRKNLRALYALGSVGTLLGLIGTISGMIKAFQVASAGGLGKSELLSRGIYEAFVCTFGGLAVAIIATAFYYFFLGRVETFISDLNDSINDFADEYLHGDTIVATRDEDLPPMPALATAGVR